jgi:hypothetical protein
MGSPNGADFGEAGFRMNLLHSKRAQISFVALHHVAQNI